MKKQLRALCESVKKKKIFTKKISFSSFSNYFMPVRLFFPVSNIHIRTIHWNELFSYLQKLQ